MNSFVSLAPSALGSFVIPYEGALLTLSKSNTQCSNMSVQLSVYHHQSGYSFKANIQFDSWLIVSYSVQAWQYLWWVFLGMSSSAFHISIPNLHTIKPHLDLSLKYDVWDFT